MCSLQFAVSSAHSSIDRAEASASGQFTRPPLGRVPVAAVARGAAGLHGDGPSLWPRAVNFRVVALGHLRHVAGKDASVLGQLAAQFVVLLLGAGEVGPASPVHLSTPGG